MAKLFAPLKVGDLSLKNRIILAPLTRNRNSYERIPNDLMLNYYTLRSEFGLIITEATSIELRGVGYPRTPGIWNEEQIKHWAKITDEVHRKGGTIFMQLWHVGRISDPMYIKATTKVNNTVVMDHTVAVLAANIQRDPRWFFERLMEEHGIVQPQLAFYYIQFTGVNEAINKLF